MACFLIFINDVSSTCIGQAKLKLFNDDVKLQSSFNVNVCNCGNLQHLLSAWAKSCAIKHQYKQI